MRNFFLPITFLALAFTVQAQDKEIVNTKANSTYASNSYDKWSIELNVGGVNALYNWSENYKDTEFLAPLHVDLGLRYMFNNKFGLKLDAGYDKIKEGGNSIEFESQQFRASFQGVLNLGRLLTFEDWTKSFSVLFHAGGGLSVFQNDLLEEDDKTVHLMAGLTGQFRLSDRFALTLDLTGLNNLKMESTWNGLPRDEEYITVTTVIPSQVVNGETIPGQTVTSQVKNPASEYTKSLNPWLNATLGLTYYFGNRQHADWIFSETESLKERVDNIEEMLKDDDDDGVPNYLDQEPDSAPGAVVDTKGRTIDSNENGIPDVIEQYIRDNYPEISGTPGVLSDSNILKQLIDSGIINVYFDYDKSTPFNASVGGIDFVVEYLKLNPNASIDILGYADPVGGSSYNQSLSQKRADAVKQIIVGKGIEASRLNAKGQGIDGNFQGSAVSSHQLARRVIFKIR